MAADTLVDQVLAQVDNARQRLAMLMGAYLEGGWGPTFNPGDNDTSFGPFQMHWGGALGPVPTDAAAQARSRAKAEDPQWAVGQMKAAYAAAVAQVPAALWKSDPERAGETAARIAERPASDYYATDGQSAIDAAFKRSNAAVVSGGGGGGSWTDYLNPVTDAKKLLGAGTSAAGSVAGDAVGAVLGPIYSDFKDFAIKMTFTVVGLGLASLGVYQTVKPTVDRANAAATAAAETAAKAAVAA